MKVNLEKLMKVSEKNEFPFENVIRLENNKVFVKLSEKGGKDYHFFNDVFAAAYPELNSQGEYSGKYIITISENEEKKRSR